MYRCEKCESLIKRNNDILDGPLIIIDGKNYTCELINPAINHNAICSDFKQKTESEG